MWPMIAAAAITAASQYYNSKKQQEAAEEANEENKESADFKNLLEATSGSNNFDSSTSQPVPPGGSAAIAEALSAAAQMYAANDMQAEAGRNKAIAEEYPELYLDEAQKKAVQEKGLLPISQRRRPPVFNGDGMSGGRVWGATA